MESYIVKNDVGLKANNSWSSTFVAIKGHKSSYTTRHIDDPIWARRYKTGLITLTKRICE
jgi:hypothetical protein